MRDLGRDRTTTTCEITQHLLPMEIHLTTHVRITRRHHAHPHDARQWWRHQRLPGERLIRNSEQREKRVVISTHDLQYKPTRPLTPPSSGDLPRGEYTPRCVASQKQKPARVACISLNPRNYSPSRTLQLTPSIRARFLLTHAPP